ncbi:hypothetical protein [Oscillatoria sp. FACHB-1406]|uniref:hypothetical protein n=1 Tax=Oscillatoria sp. FACHB-1406 TaxID=2692846 RepID=UPI00168A1340|nr:hypothetical protein [Oscillatoria sp. FACHB-1406]MBD2576210.1 hypothetical protein [Oscillatoria sp. FACHB-1406]
MKRTQFPYPLDRVALLTILVLSVAIALMAWGSTSCTGDCWLHAGPRVRQFSWQNKKVSAEDTAFLLTFSRPMDRASVEENLTLKPALGGKISWVGRTMAYTLHSPAPYGTEFALDLKGARERFSAKETQGPAILPFEGKFSTRDRVFAYIGAEGEEQGRLILFNMTTEKKTVLTPPNLVVNDFIPYPERDRILFAAVERGAGSIDVLEQQLYEVPTGLDTAEPTANSIERVVNNQDYQNLKFDLSRDGKNIVIQRINRKNPADTKLWIKRENNEIQPLNDTPSGDFAIAPDSQTLVAAKGEGIAVFPLNEQEKALDFLPQFGRILSFNRDGSAAVFVNFNQNDPKLRYVQSLYVVDALGTQRKVADVKGSIVNCQFSPSSTILYCLLTEVSEGEKYLEKPYFAAIDLEKAKGAPIVKLPDYRDIQMSLAPDGIGVLFDRIIVDSNLNDRALLRTNSGDAIVSSKLWLLIAPSAVPDEKSQPDLVELPLTGMRPRWLP